MSWNTVDFHHFHLYSLDNNSQINIFFTYVRCFKWLHVPESQIGPRRDNKSAEWTPRDFLR